MAQILDKSNRILYVKDNSNMKLYDKADIDVRMVENIVEIFATSAIGLGSIGDTLESDPITSITSPTGDTDLEKFEAIQAIVNTITIPTTLLPFADIYVDTTSIVTTTIAGSNTPTLANVNTLTGVLNKFTHNSSGRLTYKGTADIKAIVSIQMTFTSASSNQDVSVYIAKNGSIAIKSRMIDRIGTGTSKAFIATVAIGALSENDFIEAFIENNTSGGDLTVEAMIISII